MRRLLLSVAGIWLLAAVAPANTINWGSDPSQVLDHASAVLSSSSYGNGLSELVQLVFAGANGTADVARAADSSDGSTADDVVVAYKWIGFGIIGSGNKPGRWDAIGNIDGYLNSSYANGSTFYLRAWELPSPGGTGNMSNGVPPVYYGNSELFTVANNDQFQNADSFYTSGFSTTLQAIPEPALGLLTIFLGAGLIRLRRRRRW